MQNRMIGSSGIEVAPLAMGGNVFGWTANEATSFRLLDAFVDSGGTMIDTADGYSQWVEGHVGGESETVIGRWLARDPAKRQRVIIASKVGMMGSPIIDGEYVASLSPDAVVRSAEASLARLGIETIDLYYQHRDDPAVPLADSLGAFDALVKAGKVRAVGLSNFEPARIEEALVVARREGLTVPCAYQGWYNLLERGKYEDAIQEIVTANGMSFFPFYAIANGYLAGKYRSKEDLGKSTRGLRNIGYLEGKGPRVLAALDAISAETGATLAAIALAWTRDRPGIAAPIASSTSLEQLHEQLSALSLQLSLAQIQRLDEASA